jgi:hypothetical protein
VSRFAGTMGAQIVGRRFQVLSDRTRQGWLAFSAASGEDGISSDQLSSFVVGLHRRGETIDPDELKGLLEATPLPPEAQDWILAFIGPALDVLATYDRVVQSEDEWYDEEEMVGPGYLVI